MHNIQLVKIQPEERLAASSELNPASCLVTGCGEARGMGYWAATQVKGLSPEIVIVPEADVVVLTEGSTLIADSPIGTWQGDASPAGSETVARYQTDIMGTRETQSVLLTGVCAIKPINGKTVQTTLWESDQFIVPEKQGNACRGKGLAGARWPGRDTPSILRDGQGVSTKLWSITLRERRGCTPEEPDEGKLQVRFCEGAHSNLGAITSKKSVLWALLDNNNCSSNRRTGIDLGFSNNNSIFNNICYSNDGHAMSLSASSNNKLMGNVMIENGIDIWGDSLSDYTHEIDVSNTVNGKPVYLWKDVEGGRIPDGAGQVILVNCTNVVVENQNLNEGSVGIEVAFSSHITIKNNNCSSNNVEGICLWYSNDSSITNNICTHSDEGIWFWYSNDNSITNNICSYNEWGGIYLQNSNYNVITNNNCSSNRISVGIYFHDSNSNSIMNNNCSSNGRVGIDLGYSNSNSIMNNNCSSNGRVGIDLGYSNSNSIYLNNFMNNGDNVYSYDSTNIWNYASPITYTYNSNTYTNYLGNYWGDYTDIDADIDGIWDHPRAISSDKDNHPLVDPFQNYITPLSPDKLLNVHFFSQRDPAWNTKKLDHSPYSIGGYGCALTSVAMLSNYFGYDTDPGRLNTSLTEVGGLDIYGMLHWQKLEQVTGGKLKWIGWSGANWETIGHELSKRNPVIANVSYPTTGYPYHFIIFIGKSGDSYYFLDPYDEQKQIREWPNGKLGTYTLNNLRIYHGTSSITITAYSPVDIVATDPDNLTVSKQSNDIPGASYTEEDMNGDGDPDDVIFIPYRKTGEYLISVVKEAEAAPDDKYTLVVSTESENTTLAENVSVGEVPTESYEFESTFYFDTGSSNKPYPSISGTHNGTIKLNQMMTVQKLYTYSCAGTGGHTEYVRLWNSTLNVTATWNGYTEDWHNLSFKEPFTLVAGETYNYTICTGSYPQVHHIPALRTTNGWLNCTQFIDANGRIYYGWIPAIKLFP